MKTHHRGGQLKATTRHDDSKVLREVKKFPAASVVKALNLKVSSRSVLKRAYAGYTAAKMPFISKKFRLRRLQYAREHINWSVK